MSAEARLKELGITLPEPPAAVAAYVPYAITGNLVFIAGQVNFSDGKLTHSGVVGRDVKLDEAVEDARVCGLNVLAQLRAAAGSLDSVARLVRVGVFVSSAETFHAQPQVANGASELFVEVLGEAGRHARAAVGVSALPLGATVEVEAVAALA